MSNHTQEWHDARRHHLGASEVATILGVNPYGSPYEVWAIKRGIIPPVPYNDAMQLGVDLEPALLDVAERDLGDLDRDVVVEHPELPLRATLDGRVVATGQPVEIKTAGLMSGRPIGWGDEGDVVFDDQVPASYFIQVQVQLMCSGHSTAMLYALVPGRGIVKYRVRANREAQQLIADRSVEWWNNHMTQGNPPPLVNASQRVLNLIPRNESTVQLDDDVNELVDRLEVIKHKVKQLGSERRTLEAAIIEQLGNNDSGALPGGRTVTYYQTERKAYTREVAASTYRTLRVKKGKA